jgi:hypothetical protein
MISHKVEIKRGQKVWVRLRGYNRPPEEVEFILRPSPRSIYVRQVGGQLQVVGNHFVFLTKSAAEWNTKK